MTGTMTFAGLDVHARSTHATTLDVSTDELRRTRFGASGAPAERPYETLRALADQTHGQFIPIYTSASYQVALDHLADRLATEVMVEYLVPPGSSSGNDVQLGVRIPGARVKGLGAR